MAKLGKIKINRAGEVRSRTTDKGDIELYLHYNSDEDYFFFEREELNKYFDNTRFDFSDCKTKSMAIRMLRERIIESTEKKKMISLEIRLTAKFDENDVKEFPKCLNSNCHISDKSESNNRYDKTGFELGFRNIMRLGNEKEGYLYVQCDEDWEYKKSYERYEYFYSSNSLIEWDEKTELFLMNMQNQMNNMCKNIVNFFNVTNTEELKQKMNDSPLMISDKKYTEQEKK